MWLTLEKSIRYNKACWHSRMAAVPGGPEVPWPKEAEGTPCWTTSAGFPAVVVDGVRPVWIPLQEVERDEAYLSA